MRSRRRGGTAARVLTAVGAAVAVLAVAGGGAVYASTRQGTPTYRTATVGTRSVDQVLAETGTIEPSTAAVVTFPVSGTVASVRVAMGDRVKAGQLLATLDATSLRAAVASSAATVANARLTLYQAETGQTGTSSTGTGGSTRAGSSSTQGSGSGSARAIAAAQQRLLAVVRRVDALLATTRKDLATATSLCGPGGPGGSPSPTPSTSPPASPSPSPSAPPVPGGPGPGPGGGAPTTCAQGQQLVLADETGVAQRQQDVSRQETARDRLIASSSTGGAGGTSTGARSSGSASSASTSTVSAAQLAADQAAVDAAQAERSVADQNLAQASIVSPILGVVSSVGLTVGSQATAGSVSSAVDVIDPNGHLVTLSVDVAKIPGVKVGDEASVVPDGSTAVLAATVSSVAAAPSTSGGSAYTVRLAFSGRPAGLRDGIQAAVRLTTVQAAGALSVPTSAVYHLGQQTYVLVMDGGGTTRRQIVTVGAVGALYTQITGGLAAGQQVVLADVGAAIPTASSNGRLARFAAGVGAGGLGGLGAAAPSRG